eukprot:1141842-Pelagomonas_calceolata.AAC.1
MVKGKGAASMCRGSALASAMHHSVEGMHLPGPLSPAGCRWKCCCSWSSALTTGLPVSSRLVQRLAEAPTAVAVPPFQDSASSRHGKDRIT